LRLIRATLGKGQENGEEDDEGPSMDEGRCADVKDFGTREDKDNGDRAETEANARSDVSEGERAWGNAGWRSKEATGVNAMRL
jgi:hypothetical protein